MRQLFINLGKDEKPKYAVDTPTCDLEIDSLGPIVVDTTVVGLGWVAEQLPNVKLGGFNAPKDCRSQCRVAIITVLYRNHKRHLGIFLYYLHRLLMKQLMEYRIFVIEPFDTDKFNKGMLYNIAYLESQRFGTWDCLIFHEMYLIPTHEEIIYGCSISPIHLPGAVVYKGLVAVALSGGATALTPVQYENVNGYSNKFWEIEGADDDMRSRLRAQDYAIIRYNASMAIYVSLSRQGIESEKVPLNFTSIRRAYNFEGLSKTKYSLVNVTKERLYTHIVAHISPDFMRAY